MHVRGIYFSVTNELGRIVYSLFVGYSVDKGNILMRFQVLMVASIKMVFWDVASYIVLYKLTDVSELATRCNIPEGSRSSRKYMFVLWPPGCDTVRCVWWLPTFWRNIAK
jgi:hypothetical protein